MKQLYIIGKGPGTEGYNSVNMKLLPGHTLGLNEAAIQHRTRWAMTGHTSVYYKLMNHYGEVGKESIIITDPFFEGVPAFAGHRTVKQLIDSYALNMTDVPESIIYDLVEDAAANRTDVFRQWRTVLHLTMFWAIYMGYKRVHLMACTNEPGGSIIDPKQCAHMKRATQYIMAEALTYGTQFIMHNSSIDFINHFNKPSYDTL